MKKLDPQYRLIFGPGVWGADGSTLSLRAPLFEVGGEETLERPQLVFIDTNFNEITKSR